MGGFRVVRRLGAGEHANVLLAHPLQGEGAVALKVASDGRPERVIRELEALDRGAGEHVVRLVDAATDDRGMPMIVMERHPGLTLADLLVRRERLTPGEARTVLTAITAAVSRLHASGITHGGVRADAVLVSARGEPLLGGFGSARVSGATPSRAARDADPAMIADCDGVRTLSLAVLAASGSFSAMETVRSRRAGSDLLDEIAAVAKALGDPSPVSPPANVMAHSEGLAPSRPDRLPPDREGAPARQRGRRAAPRPTLGARMRGLAGHARGRLAEVTRSVRPRFWMIGAAGVLALAAALVLVPVRATDATPPVAPPSTVPSPDPTVAAAEGEPDAVEETPEDAVIRLLVRRAECVRDRSLTCLDDVVQAGSSARRDDEAMLRALEAGEPEDDPWSDIDPSSVSVIDEYGGAALVALLRANGEPASVLVMRTEAGWRIRSYLGSEVAS